MLVFALVCINLCPFSLCDQINEEDRAGCFAFLSFGSIFEALLV